MSELVSFGILISWLKENRILCGNLKKKKLYRCFLRKSKKTSLVFIKRIDFSHLRMRYYFSIYIYYVSLTLSCKYWTLVRELKLKYWNTIIKVNLCEIYDFHSLIFNFYIVSYKLCFLTTSIFVFKYLFFSTSTHIALTPTYHVGTKYMDFDVLSFGYIGEKEAGTNLVNQITLGRTFMA